MSGDRAKGPEAADEALTESEVITFTIKDSGERDQFESGMQRDTEEGKIDYTYVIPGPMLDRWATHLQKGAEKYDRDNWLQGNSMAEYDRARRSAARHMVQWLRGEQDEDHAAAVFFNLNAAEYFKDQLVSLMSTSDHDPDPEVDEAVIQNSDWFS